MPTAADNTLVRTTLAKTNDDGEQQKVQADGRYEERYGTEQHGVPRVQQYGFSGHSPAGSHGMTMTPDGNPDKAMMVGLEHPKYRPKNLAEGEWKQYDMWNGECHAKEDGWHWKIGDAEIHVKQNGEITLKGTKIILDGIVYAGGPDADREASHKGTLDTGGLADFAPVATRVFVK